MGSYMQTTANKKLANTTAKFFLVVILLSANSVKSVGYPARSSDTFPQQVFWGDTHVHTSMSLDASGWGGNKKLSPTDAYRFARGESVVAHNGLIAKLSKPLDFIVVADHAEGLGVIGALENGSALLRSVQSGQKLYKDFLSVTRSSLPSSERQSKFINFAIGIIKKKLDSAPDLSLFRRSVWQSVAETADHHNQPGVFTTFIGYEWSSTGESQEGSGNLHRIVIFANSFDKAAKVQPFSSYDSTDPAALWKFMAAYEKETDGQILAIPHNGNLSNGEMFNDQMIPESERGAYAKIRMRWEPLYEVTQIKGDGEAYPLLSPDDEFADFETWNSWSGVAVIASWDAQERERKKSSYARSALKMGLQTEMKLGVNPFKFGMIGSTDSHTSLASAEENNFWGKWSNNEPHATRQLEPLVDAWTVPGWQVAASGYTGIWAEENTREALFAAMKRKEVYATTGPRISVRFFGGWDYQPDDAYKPNLASIGYEKGVPMGGDLTTAPEDLSPTFLIHAVKDPDGAHLDRVQVVKGWSDAKGDVHEKIYNVALSDGRKDQGSKTLSVGNTVDIPGAIYTNTIGDPELAVVWKDPDFDKHEHAFYYLRVLEIPTPRWTAYDANYFQLRDLPEEIPMVIQERAYSSPIWYVP